MAIRKRRKNSRQRGSHTHGWGAKKKHRGSGNRGGAGHSGTGKRSDSNKPSVWSNPRFEGGHGFSPIGKRRQKTISIRQLDERLLGFVHEKRIDKQGELYIVDLERLGYDKLLGGGRLHHKIRVDAALVSEGAKKAIEEAKGELAEAP